jgi:hypothetical protein
MPPLVDHPWVDCSHYPVFLLKYPSSAPDCVVEDCFKKMELFYATNTRHFGWIQDLNDLSWAPGNQRRIVAEHIKRTEEHLSDYCAGIAYFCTKTAPRGFLTAVYWLQPPPHPYVVYASMDDCWNWIRQQLKGKVDTKSL